MEFSEWLAYDRIDPIGPERVDYSLAMVASVIANVNRPKGKSPYKVEAFKPRYGPRQEQTPDELLAKAERINKMFGGLDHRRRDGDAS